MLRSLFTVLIFSISIFTAFAQNGSIGGQVVDHKSNEAIIGANVVIQGTTIGSSTDLDGNFSIANLKPGTYTLSVTYVAYKAQTIADVVVEAGKKTSLQITLVEDVAELQEVVVTAKREISTDMNLLNAIKESKLVVSGISSEQILRLPDRDAAQVMQRVPGVTIQDGRFVLVRGVPERYNQVMINGIVGPSTEIDKRSFSFDLIPAGTVDQMLIYKSGTAELPGDFAGGVIQMITKNPSYEPFTSVGLTFGFRAQTTFGDFISSEGSSTDVFGFDNGFRDLPSNFLSTSALKASQRNSSVRERAGKSLTNNFANKTSTARPDMGFNVATSQRFKIGNIELSNLTALAYSNSFQYYKSDFLRYNTFSETSAEKRFEYFDSFYSNDVRVNGMHNWAININDRNKIDFKNLFVQLGENETTIRSGHDFIQRPNDDMVNYAYHYLSRSIYSGQLDGTHTLGDGTIKLNWVVGTNLISRNEPDYRRFRTYRDQNASSEAPFTMQLPPSGNLFETGRFWSDLKDKSYSHGLNFEKKFGPQTEKRVATIKAGYYVEQKSRSFNARYMNYLYPGTFDQSIGMELSQLPLDQIFAAQNIKKENGFVIEEGTTSQDSYNGENFLSAGYVTGNLPLGKFDMSLGFRGEYNVQKLSAISNTGQKINVDNPVFAPLPFMNVAYNINDRSLVRVAYSRTVNRPEFRELAPFLYYQFEYEAGVFGNPDLKTAFIHNIDARYEIYPNPGELFSIGAFYKNFTDPIESYLQITTETPQQYFANSPSAMNYGVEVEIKKSLASLGVAKILRNTSLNFNGSLIKSEVDIGSNATNQVRYRPLQGQSPYIVNFNLFYNDEEVGWSANVGYNVFGPRIFYVGDVIFPSWWEMPRQSLDLQFSKKWGKNFETKLNAQNLLNAAYRLYQDNNNDQKIKDTEALIQKYQVGTQYSIGLSWKIQGN